MGGGTAYNGDDHVNHLKYLICAILSVQYLNQGTTMKWKLVNKYETLFFKTLKAARHYAQYNGGISFIQKIRKA